MRGAWWVFMIFFMVIMGGLLYYAQTVPAGYLGF